MRTLYFECQMGAAGDMICAALLELQNDVDAAIEALNQMGLEVVYRARRVMSHGIGGYHMDVLIDGKQEIVEDACVHHHHHGDHACCEHHHHHEENEEHGCCEHHHHHDDHEEHECCGHHHHHDDHEDHACCEHHHHHDDHEDHACCEHHHHHHEHRGMAEIESIVHGLNVSDKVRKDILGIYRMIAEAESHAHQCPVEQIHFHEVGTMDAIADITASCWLIDKLGVDRIIVSPINVGSGWVRCAHGILPVPAPATAYILAGAPMYRSEIQGELCTPTGAAILRYFAAEFSASPILKYEKIGYGIGTKSFDRLNCIRAYLGSSDISDESNASGCLCDANAVPLIQLECNLDDMTPEYIAYAISQLFKCGALDVWTTAIGMKKNRPAQMLSCLCTLPLRNDMIRAIFAHTSTLGIREIQVIRHQLSRSEYAQHTPYGSIRIKRSEGFGIVREKPEFEDIIKASENSGLSVAEVLNALKDA